MYYDQLVEIQKTFNEPLLKMDAPMMMAFGNALRASEDDLRDDAWAIVHDAEGDTSIFYVWVGDLKLIAITPIHGDRLIEVHYNNVRAIEDIYTGFNGQRWYTEDDLKPRTKKGTKLPHAMKPLTDLNEYAEEMKKDPAIGGPALPDYEDRLKALKGMYREEVQQIFAEKIFMAVHDNLDDIYDWANVLAALDNVHEFFRIEMVTLWNPDEAEAMIDRARRQWTIKDRQREYIEYQILGELELGANNLEYDKLPEDLKESLLALQRLHDTIRNQIHNATL